MFNDGMIWLSEAKELTIFSEYLEQGCLLRDVIATTMTHMKESSFVMNFNGFKIELKRNDQITNIFSCKDLLSYIKLKDLQFVDLNFQVPQLTISSSPLDVAVSLLCHKLFARKVHHHRNGRLLWNVAASKIRSVTSAPRVTLYRLMTTVIHWLRYLHSYEDLLSLLGYPSIHKLKRSAFRVSEDKTFLGVVKHRLKVISDMEKELQPEAIVYARRIGRYRISQEISVQVVTECRFTNHMKFLRRIFELLSCFVRAMCKLLMYILSPNFLKIPLLQEQENGPFEGLSAESHLESNISLNVETVVVTVSLKNESYPSCSDDMELHSGVYSDVLLFRVEIGAISVKYIDVIFEQSLFLSCGRLTVSSTVIGTGSASGSSLRSATHQARGYQYGNFTCLDTIVWTEALTNYFSPVTDDNEDDDSGFVGGDSYLQKFLGEMWKKWKDTCHKFEETDATFVDNPFILFEIKSYLTCPGPSSSAPGFLKCNLMVGTLNLAVGCSSTESIALLVRQMNRAFCWRDRIDNLQSAHPGASEDQSDISWNSEHRSYFCDVKEALLEILPEKHIELAAFISGPRVQTSFQKDGFIIGKNIDYPRSYDFQLVVELHDIKVALWPTSESTLDGLTKCIKKSDSEPENVMLEEHFKLNIATVNDDKYTSQMLVLLNMYLRASGLTAYMENLRMKQKMQIFALKPLTFQLSSFRQVYNTCLYLIWISLKAFSLKSET